MILHSHFYYRLRSTDDVLLSYVPCTTTTPQEYFKDNMRLAECDGKLININGLHFVVGPRGLADTRKTVAWLDSWLWTFCKVSPGDTEFQRYFVLSRIDIYESEFNNIEPTSTSNYNKTVHIWLKRNIAWDPDRKYYTMSIPTNIDYSKYPHVLAITDPEKDPYYRTSVASEITKNARDRLGGVVKRSNYRSAPGIFFFKNKEDALLAKLSFDDSMMCDYINLEEAYVTESGSKVKNLQNPLEIKIHRL